MLAPAPRRRSADPTYYLLLATCYFPLTYLRHGEEEPPRRHLPSSGARYACLAGMAWQGMAGRVNAGRHQPALEAARLDVGVITRELRATSRLSRLPSSTWSAWRSARRTPVLAAACGSAASLSARTVRRCAASAARCDAATTARRPSSKHVWRRHAGSGGSSNTSSMTPTERAVNASTCAR